MVQNLDSKIQPIAVAAAPQRRQYFTPAQTPHHNDDALRLDHSSTSIQSIEHERQRVAN